jgi:hypothetical protein
LQGTVIDITNRIARFCDHPFKNRSRGRAREEAMADNREAIMFKKVPDGYVFLMLGVSQAIMAIALIMLALQKTDGGRISMLADGGAFVLVFSAAVLVVSSLAFLAAALDKARRKQFQSEPAQRSFKTLLLPMFCIAVSIALLGLVIANAFRIDERQHQVALVQGRLDNLKARMDGSQIRSRQDSLKFRIVANRARIGELLAKQSNPTVKCEPAAATDDPARLENLQACREFARKEQEDVQNELASARAESEAIQQENAVLQKEVDSIHTQVDALQREITTIGK